MSLSPEQIPEYEQVRQHHDAMMELGRLELLAEQLRENGAAQEPAELLSTIERQMRELGLALAAPGSLKS